MNYNRIYELLFSFGTASEFLHDYPDSLCYDGFNDGGKENTYPYPFNAVYGVTNLLSFGGYSLFILVKIRLHGRRLQDHVSYHDFYLEMQWLEYIMISLLSLTILLAFVIPLSRFFPDLHNRIPQAGPGLPGRILVIHSIATLLFVYLFSLFSIKQYRRSSSAGEFSDLSIISDSYDDSVNQGDKNRIGELKAFMEESRIYLDNGLSLQILSDKTGIGRNELSGLINRSTGKNFFHFINGYRAREFRKSVRENRYPYYNLLSIGMECGFNSKSTFNEAVKREFGKTPSQLFRENSGK